MANTEELRTILVLIFLGPDFRIKCLNMRKNSVRNMRMVKLRN